jgi:hypothetical protein
VRFSGRLSISEGHHLNYFPIQLKSLLVAAGLCQTFGLASAVAETTELEAHIITTLKDRFANGSRYVIGTETTDQPHKHCTEIKAGNALLTNQMVVPYAKLADGTAAKLLECSYPFPNPDVDHRRGWVIVVAATPANLATRIAGACMAAASAKARDCADRLLSDDPAYPWGSNNLIYPITGFVREPCKSGENLIGFRHGVTIQYTDGPASHKKFDYCVTKNTPVEVQRTIGLTFGTFDVFKFGRVAALSREDESIGPFAKAGEGTLSGLAPDGFQAFVRDNEIKAVETGYDRMMVVKAARAMGVPVPKAP